ncbi:bifunctional RecB family nuclease/DEAD/DEAH box helicase [Nocardia mangyaensis]|uniref:bifunctional RecB family nuclease/DEAD/DEAH box helicase n=1 Tax=Nocardia mangyaensis TaxID=2213200 RepID=UPI0026770EB6|nr:bifunctional RecB family nuclease/DEAD/DEAH box helicase [Nocardia mangyaensis]MDO3645408.1 AAA domain-containing protein [Nocardia mangyaensis]
MSGDRVVGAVGDLARAADCEFALLRAIDAALGNLPGSPDTTPLLHTPEPTADLLRQVGESLTRIPSPEAVGTDPAARIAALTSAAEATTAALRAGAPAIYGAVFFDGRFACGIDLLLRSADDARYTLHAGVAATPVRPPAAGVAVCSGLPGPSGWLVEPVRTASTGEPVVASRDIEDASALPEDIRVLRRELAAGRTPFERVAASVNAIKVDVVRESLCARLEFAAAAHALAAVGVAVDPSAYLSVIGGVRREPAAALAPLYLARRARVERVIEEKLTELLPVQWGDPRYLACGRCPSCRAAAANARDLLLVAGIRPTQRARLRESGVLTIDRLATTSTPVPGLAPRTVAALRRQAEIQLDRERTGTPTFALRDATALGSLPAPTPGDLALIIDLDHHATITAVELSTSDAIVFRTAGVTVERTNGHDARTPATTAMSSRPAGPSSADRNAVVFGSSTLGSDPMDPAHRRGNVPAVQEAVHHRPTGYGNADTTFSRDRFVDDQEGPAETTSDGNRPADAVPYRSSNISPASPGAVAAGDRPTGGGDRAAESSAVGNGGTNACPSPVSCPPTHDGGVLDELLDIIGEHRATDPNVRVYHYGSGVRTALLDWAGRLGTGADLLDELLAEGALVDLAPVVRTALLVGEQSYDVAGLAALVPGAAGRAATVLGIRDWLLDRAVAAGVEVPGTRFAVAESEAPPSLRPGSLEAALAEFAADAEGDAACAASLMAAILGYHRRERQPRWWAHIDRLGHPVGEWADAPGVLVAEWGTVDTKWHRTPQLPTMRRYLTLTGRLGTGATLTPGTQMVTIYDGAAAAGMTQTLGRRATATATVLGCAVDANFDDTVRLEELLPAGCPPYDDLPAAIAPGPPDGEAEIEAALEFTAQDLLMTLPRVPENAVYDLLLRRAPRLRDGRELPPVHADIATTLAAAVGALDASYLAVHGPPGTGKTGTTGRAIERLVTRHRWRIGVVAQSHAVIERIFDAVVEAGLLPELVAKKDVASVGPDWSGIEASRYPRFLDNAVNGCVIGGTAADFVDGSLIAPGALDLLVIADAGDFSLADTVAVAVSARNLLLIGDPVPARALAAHPQPVQVSALEWLCEGAPTLPAERGYFLDTTWRMHPALCEPVSASCYGGRLRAGETGTRARDLAGISPGVSTVLVEHRGSATESDAEAREVVRRVRALLGQTWTADGRAHKLHPHDVFVVAPYAAQVARIRTLLARAKIEDVLVGTPDRFRGREAAVVLLSMTTSTPADAPFGMRPLLSRTVIHATLCRAMWKAIVIRSPLLTEYLPDTPEELAALVGFLRLDT